MKLLLDQGLPRSAVQELAVFGIAALHVGNLGLAAASDDVILDFKPSVIRIRIEGSKAVDLARLLVQVVTTISADLMAGAAVSITTPGFVRVRRLPIT